MRDVIKMSDVVLASKYAAENYPIALNNLAKRYQKEDGEEDVHFSELGFGDISDQQAKVCLRFFADIGLIENTKHANYIPPDSVVTWQRKMGEKAEEAKKDVRQSLLEYDVFSETMFILEEGGEELESLAEQVGGMIGIDEDEMSEMTKTIEVFSEIGFVEIDEENVVSLPDSFDGEVSATEEAEEDEDGESDPENSTDETLEEFVEDDIEQKGKSNKHDPVEDGKHPSSLKIDLDISIDATEMGVEDLQEKLEIIKDIAKDNGK